MRIMKLGEVRKVGIVGIDILLCRVTRLFNKKPGEPEMSCEEVKVAVRAVVYPA